MVVSNSNSVLLVVYYKGRLKPTIFTFDTKEQAIEHANKIYGKNIEYMEIH